MPLTVKVEGGCRASLEPRSFSLRQGSAERQRKMANSLLEGGGTAVRVFTGVDIPDSGFCISCCLLFPPSFWGGGIGVT